MNRKRSLISDTFKAKKRKGNPGNGCENDACRSPFPGVAQDAHGAMKYLTSLFPRKLFNNSLPPMVFKHQIYSLVRDKTAVDRQLNELKDRGEIRFFQHGFSTDVFGMVFTEDYRDRVLAGSAGKECSLAVQRFLESVLTCSDLSFSKEKMMQEFSFQDRQITELVKAGVLTVRDAGSWWLAVPGAGRFVKHFLHGRKALLGMIKKTKYKEVMLSDLQGRKVPTSMKLGLEYHIHDIIGAELVDCVATTSGTLLRLADI
ncbi:winged helix repair factor 1 [Microcaecilia unicolor]|uniref:Serine/threonine-protein kinase 19 n=1 Tax=Microcaecilia unicolor TaxID=1415580 RepID=A0A6P7XJ11_9AMPH|nr:serine/threonine-protein kinase 19 [Microcaecilia unicolor]XP_030053192.1 serine/threonine-protein kinase 19 [Microcaecilia unicolor]